MHRPRTAYHRKTAGYLRILAASLIGASIVAMTPVAGFAQDTPEQPKTQQPKKRPEKRAAQAKPAAPAPQAASDQPAPQPAATPAPAPQPQPQPAQGAQGQPTPDPLIGDWKVIWLNKGNAVSQLHLTAIDRQPAMAAGNGTFIMQDGKECRLDSGLVYHLYGQVPSGDQIMTLNYTDVWKLVAHCPDNEISFDLVATAFNGQLTAIGRGIINKKGAPADSSFVLLQR